MGRAAWRQANFTAGEISPLLFAAGDNNIRFYSNGLARCLNMLPLVQGAVTRRPGTKFAGNVISASVKSRLFPFKFSVTQAYAIEFGNQKIGWYLNHGPLLESNKTITGITQANPGVVTSAAHGFSNGDRVYISGVVGMTQVNGRVFTVAGVTANTFQLSGVNTTSYTAYSSGGTAARLYVISSPYLEADLPAIKYTQSQDVLYLFHPDYAPRKLSRSAATSWSLDVVDFYDGPYLPENITATTITPGATSGTTTFTASTAIFASTDVGRHIRLQDAASNWYWIEITGFTSTTVVSGTIYEVGSKTAGTLSSAAARTTWRLGSWSDTTGWPTCATFYEDRLCLGGEPAQRVDTSNSGDYENMQPTEKNGSVLASNGASYTLNADDVNRIRWMLGMERGLVIGTYGDEWVLRPSNQNEALTPDNVKAVPTTKHGSSDFSAIRTDGAALFINRSSRAVHEFAYSFESDSFKAPDMTVVAEHLLGDGVSYLDYQREPDSIIWTISGTGSLLGFTYSREQQVTGWHEHVLGGVSDANGTQAIVESIAVIPEPNGAYDEVWLTVKRYDGSAVFRTVEYMTERWREGRAQEDAFFVDCGLTYDGTATTTISGLNHLEGLEVSVLTDGGVHPNKTVSGGTITLDRSSAVVQVGLAYDGRVKILPVELGAQNGANLGKTKRINNVATRVWESGGAKLGPDETKLSPLLSRPSGTPMGQSPPIVSQWVNKRFEGAHTDEAVILYVQDQPLPLTILAVAADIETSDR